MKVNRDLNAILFFGHQKTIKNRQALHEIIGASSLSITFVELSFKPLYHTMVVKNFKFMKNYHSWKMYLQVKILSLGNFTHMLKQNRKTTILTKSGETKEIDIIDDICQGKVLSGTEFSALVDEIELELKAVRFALNYGYLTIASLIFMDDITLVSKT